MRLDPHEPCNLLITGGGGFVGGNFLRLALKARPAWRFTVLDHLGSRHSVPILERLEQAHPGRFRLQKMGLEHGSGLAGLFAGEAFHAVVHFAAKNPSGREEGSPLDFTRVNVLGTAAVLEAVRLSGGNCRFLHLSSYEVYGSHPMGWFTESTSLKPTTPYAASKAAADSLTLSYHRTFGLDGLVSRTSNIYGPYQSSDKFIPSLADKAFADRPMPVFGSGEQMRDWIHVDDHNRGVLAILERGRGGEVYHIGARCEQSNAHLAQAIADAAAEVRGLPGGSLRELITRVEDRVAHDSRRALDTEKIERELEFRPEVPFERGLKDTVKWLFEDRGPGGGA